MKLKPFLITFFLAPILASGQNPDRNYSPLNRTRYEDIRKPNLVKISPFHLFDNQFQISGEFFNAKTYRSSLVVAGNFIYADNDEVSDQGFALDVQKRIYPRSFSTDTLAFFRNRADGFYFGLGIQLGYNEYRNRELSKVVYQPFFYQEMINVSATSLWALPHVSLGYQFVVWDALFVDLFLGGGIKMNHVSKSSPDKSLELDEYYQNDTGILSRYYKGIIPRAGITLGVGF